MSLGTSTFIGGSQAINGNGSGGSSGYSSLLNYQNSAPAATKSAASNISATAPGVNPSSVPNINSIQMPSWLSTNPDSNLQELLQTYASIPSAYSPAAQESAYNSAIGYNTTAGNQAANNAATAYSNSAAQSGGSQLGAGAVKAQALLPVLSQNAQLKVQSANTAAQDYQSAATLAAQVANNIDQLRTSYLGTLTSYAQSQQQMQAQTQQFNSTQALNQYTAQQNVALQAGQQQLSYAQLAAQQYQSQTGNADAAAQALLAAKGPTGEYTTDANGQVTSGQATASALAQYQSSKAAATSYLASQV